MLERDIVFERGAHWVLRTKSGTFEVYRIGACASTRCAVIGYKGSEGFERAVNEAIRRELANSVPHS